MSALDVYDGQRWTPGLTLRPIGGQLGEPSPPSPEVAPPIQFDVELLTDDFDLVPIPGRPLAVDTDSAMGVETDLGRTVVRLTEDPRAGLTVSASAEAGPPTSAALTSRIATRQVDEISAGFTDLANSMAGDGTVFDQLQAIEDTMRDDWQLDRNAPGGGQQLALIERFVADTQQGTEEQFVTAFVLLARSLGVESRVATGFVVPPGELGSPLGLRSSHAAVWPEVLLDGVGWLAFDPVPSEQTGDTENEPPPPAAQSPAAAQPPIIPPADPATDDETVVVDQETDIGNWQRVQTWLTRGGVVGGALLLPVVTVIAAILGVKWMRRRRRLRDPDPGRRISGAWANTTDSLVDAGLAIAPAWTNDTIAEHGADLAPTVPHEMTRLASTATAITFGHADDGWDRVDDAVAAWRAVDGAIRAERTWWQRVRWRLSLRSLRRRTRSPVVV
jgi:transglutaminase-like putative cysteine protease